MTIIAQKNKPNFWQNNDSKGLSLTRRNALPMKTQISCKQYSPDKSATYGMLFKSINCTNYPYTYQLQVYCGKPIYEPNKYYVSWTHSYNQYLATKCSPCYDIRGRSLPMNRFYSNLATTDWLLENGITMVGTMIKNRVGILKDIKDVSNFQKFLGRKWK